jgi:hypothetical protein
MLQAAAGPLTREERDLLEVPTDSLTIACVLPGTEKELGETWTLTNEDLALLLGLDEVKRQDVLCKLTRVENQIAEIDISGKLTGKTLGAASALDILGTISFDTAARRFRGWNFTLKEARDIGAASPGLAITAKVSVTVSAVQEIAELADEALGGLPLIEERPEQLAYIHRRGLFAMQYDARWRILADESHQLSMRLIDEGLLVAHCNCKLIQLPGSAPPQQLSEFQAEIRQSLGKNFVRFQDSLEGTNQRGLRTLKVVAEGQVEDVPVLWLSYLFEGPKGWRVSATISLEDQLLDRFAEADRAMLETLLFLPEKETPEKETAQKPTMER